MSASLIGRLMENSLKTHGRWTFKDERHLIALAASQTPLEVVAVKLKRSVDSVGRKTAAMDISLTVLDEPRPKIGLQAKGSKIARIDVDQVREPGEYAFRDGVIRIKRKHFRYLEKRPRCYIHVSPLRTGDRRVSNLRAMPG
jgi:hypothetical protein